MSLSTRNKIAYWVVLIVGLAGFTTQSIQFFTGRWNNSFIAELTILVFFLGVALKPKFIINKFVTKLTNNNMYKLKKDDPKVEDQDLGGSGTSENGEV